MNSPLLNSFPLKPNRLSVTMDNTSLCGSFSVLKLKNCAQKFSSQSFTRERESQYYSRRPSVSSELLTPTEKTSDFNGKSSVDSSKNGIGILEFLRGKNYFITGATGFLGKAVIEKILRAAPDICKIYLLVKAENKEAALEIIKTEIIDSTLSESVRLIHGEYSYQAFMLSRLVPVPGNIGESNLAYVNRLNEGESVTSKTSSPLLHPPLDVQAEMKLALDSSLAFNKNRESAQKMKEMGLERMIDPFILGFGKGYHPAFVNPETVLDVIPVDMVVNATVSAMAKHGIARKPDLNVYHVSSSGVNPLLIRVVFDSLYEHFKSSPIKEKGKAVQIAEVKFLNSWDYIFPCISKAFIDPRESRRKFFEQTEDMIKMYQPYYSSRRFDSSETYESWEAMSVEEQTNFGFDVKSLDWKDYFVNIHIPGQRKYVMNGR